MIARRLLLPLPALLLTRCAGSAESRPGVASAPMLEMNQAGLTQGGFVAGRTAPGTRLVLEGKPVPVSADGHFALGFPRDAGPEAALSLTPPGGRTEIRRLAIAPRHWDIQRLNGLPPRQVTPNAQDLARIRAEQVRINAARAVETPVALYAAGFDWPARGRISGVYGSQRILNGEPRAPHLGLDIAVPTGTPVAPMAPGRVTLAADLYFTGNTLIVEHGQGVASLYAHLSRIDVREGQEVARGESMAHSGATGRVTGPHLHLGFFVRGVSIDPGPVLGL